MELIENIQVISLVNCVWLLQSVTKLGGVIGAVVSRTRTDEPIMAASRNPGRANLDFHQPSVHDQVGDFHDGTDGFHRIFVGSEELLIAAVEACKVEH